MQRPDFQQIAAGIDRGARVLDLGCEDGALLAHLRERRQTNGIGVDINGAQLTKCLARGLQVVHTDIRGGLSLFAEQSFDYVVLSQTLQTIDRPPQTVIGEMLRVGKTAVVSFPNFGYWRHRWRVLCGNMPTGEFFPQQWHSAPQIRHCTIDDFERWCDEQQWRVKRRVFLAAAGRRVRRLPNVLAKTAVYFLKRDGAP